MSCLAAFCPTQTDGHVVVDTDRDAFVCGKRMVRTHSQLDEPVISISDKSRKGRNT